MKTLFPLFFVLFVYAGYGQETHNVLVEINQGPDCPVVTALEESQLFKVFPNPIENTITIRTEYENSRVRILDMHGNILRDEEVTGREFFMNLQTLSSGNYLLHFESSEGDFESIKIRKK